MLLVNHVEKYYDKYQVFKEINLEFKSGVYVLLAPNGAGKTTLMKMLVTLLKPTKGTILYNGEDIYEMGERYREILGFLPQQVGYYKNYSPKEFLHYLGVLKGVKEETLKVRIPELLDLVGLSKIENKKMGKFSGGMIQRTAIAGVLINSPRILVLDEPTAGLDPKERVRFKNIISEIAKDKIVVISTHITSDVEFIANEIIMLKNKKIFQKDSVENICRKAYGKVYECVVNEKDLLAFKRKYLIISERREEEKVLVRFFSLNEREASWQIVTPTLEDVFMYEYQEELVCN